MDKDNQAKEMARRLPRTEMVARDRSGEAAARLDKRIDESRLDGSTGETGKEEARASRATAAVSAVYREPTGRRSRELANMEADVTAKSRTRGGNGGVYQSPGTLRVGTKSPHDKMERMQADRVAKEKAKATGTFSSQPLPGIRSEIAELKAAAAEKPRRATSAHYASHQLQDNRNSNRLDDFDGKSGDHMAKERAKAAKPGSANIVARQPFSDIRSEIAELAAAATGKPQRESSTSSMSSPKTRTHSNLNKFEADVAAKSQSRDYQGVAVARSHRAGTNFVLRDSGQSSPSSNTRPGITHCVDLDERIAYKAGIPIRKDEDSHFDSSSKAGVATYSDLEDKRIEHMTGIPLQKKNEEKVISFSSKPGITHCTKLDERIAYKTGIPLDDNDKEDNPAAEDEDKRYSIGNIISAKLGVNVALEKFKARHHNDIPVGDIEDKFDGQRTYFTDGTTIFGEEFDDDKSDRLAVATAVDEGKEDSFIPAAVEYDPEAKPPIYRNRRFRLYGLLACAFVVTAIATTIALISQRQAVVVYMDEPTQAPTSARYKLGIQEQLELIVGFEKLNDPESPHYHALNWIVNDDPMQLSPNDANLVQRFLLATFYFSTHEEGDWLSCNAPVGEEDQFCFFKQLVDVFPLAYRDIPWVRWLSVPHECLWAGVFCDENDEVRSIDLSGQAISSTLPAELSSLPFIQGINFSWNYFHGEIPVEYGEMKYLLTLELHHCFLTGTIPGDWSSAKNLQLFNVGGNELTGTMPSDISSFRRIKGLFLFGNFLTGDFPSNMNALQSLSKYYLTRN
jgi:hypothetical protein